MYLELNLSDSIRLSIANSCRKHMTTNKTIKSNHWNVPILILCTPCYQQKKQNTKSIASDFTSGYIGSLPCYISGTYSQWEFKRRYFWTALWHARFQREMILYFEGLKWTKKLKWICVLHVIWLLSEKQKVTVQGRIFIHIQKLGKTFQRCQGDVFTVSIAYSIKNLNFFEKGK